MTKKITQLPAASTPLAGTELLEIVQGGVSRQVAASEIGSLGGGAAVGAANVVQVSDGAGNLAAGTTPDIGAATGTSAALSSFWSTGAAPATTGAGRMTNNTYIYGDNGSGTDRRIIGISGNTVLVGGIGVDLYLGGNGTGQSINGAADTYNFRSGDSGSLFATLTSTGLALRDSSGGQFYTIGVSNLAVDRTVTLPLLGANDTFVTEAHTQTLTNKTLTSPTIGGSPVTSATEWSATGNARCRLYSAIVSVQTTDATVTNAATWTITDECVTTVTVEVDAIKSDGSVTASYIRRCRIKRDGGTVTVGSVTDVYTDEEAGFSTCDVTIDNSTSTGRVRVTGVAATTIDWGVVVYRKETTHA